MIKIININKPENNAWEFTGSSIKIKNGIFEVAYDKHLDPIYSTAHKFDVANSKIEQNGWDFTIKGTDKVRENQRIIFLSMKLNSVKDVKVGNLEEAELLYFNIVEQSGVKYVQLIAILKYPASFIVIRCDKSREILIRWDVYYMYASTSQHSFFLNSLYSNIEQKTLKLVMLQVNLLNNDLRLISRIKKELNIA